jgi:hypothetical protein
MDKAIQNALRWSLGRELRVELYAIQSRIDNCKRSLKTLTDTDKRTEIEATLKFHEIDHKNLLNLWSDLWEDKK